MEKIREIREKERTKQGMEIRKEIKEEMGNEGE